MLDASTLAVIGNFRSENGTCSLAVVNLQKARKTGSEKEIGKFRDVLQKETFGGLKCDLEVKMS